MSSSRFVSMPPVAQQGWSVELAEDGMIHIVPIGELHQWDQGCSCSPDYQLQESGDTILVHHARDHREVVEMAVRIMNGEEDV